MHIFLDLWGVLLNEVKMNKEYNERAAALLASRFGGEPSAWRRAYDSSWENYLLELAEAEQKGEDWLAVADRLDPPLILDTLRAVGVEWREPDLLSFARDIENRVAATVAEAYPDARPAMTALRSSGCKVHVATQAGEWNARGALRGSGLDDLVDMIFSGSSQRAFKSSPEYWRDIPKAAHVKGVKPILVDDRQGYLEAARSVGFIAVLMDRGRKQKKGKSAKSISATFASLSELPPFIDSLLRKRPTKRT